jgi:hypothetical protein
MSGLPPTSDIIMAFCPAGPTSITSTSSGKVWLILLSLTVTFVTVPDRPDAEMFDGYGSAGPLDVAAAGMVTAPGFVNVAGVQPGDPLGDAVGVLVEVLVGGGVPVDVFVGVFVGVLVRVGVAVFVGVLVRVAVAVFVEVAVGHEPEFEPKSWKT